MSRVTTSAIACGIAALLAAAPVSGASAKCTKLAFEVNDYGKDGPARDAQELLDKHIASWAAQNKIKSYTTGKKDVSCELFLNFVVFDEHTCRATATVCWTEGGTSVPASALITSAAPAAPHEAKKTAPARAKSQ